MKTRTILIMALTVLACEPVDTVPGSQSTLSMGTLKVERVWIDEFDTSYALVSYLNDSGRTFTAWVRTRCDAMGNDGAKLGTNTRTFIASEYGGSIRPGFTGTEKMHIELRGAELKEMQCRIESAR